jgi:hypothetical protein
MKGRYGVRWVVLAGAVVALAVQQMKAGSAVASDGKGHLSISFGHSKKFDEQSVLELARHKNGPNVYLVAASDVTGYCAIASAERREFANPGERYVYGVALGIATPEEARRLAIEQCLKMGGINPKIKSEFRG